MGIVPRSIVHLPSAGPEHYSALAPLPKERAPDWLSWHQLSEICLWEAVALSLDLEPAKIRQSGQGWMVGTRLFDDTDEFARRLTLAIRVSGNSTGSPFTVIRDADPPDRLVSLPSFIQWATAAFPDATSQKFQDLTRRVGPVKTGQQTGSAAIALKTYRRKLWHRDLVAVLEKLKTARESLLQLQKASYPEQHRRLAERWKSEGFTTKLPLQTSGAGRINIQEAIRMAVEDSS